MSEEKQTDHGLNKDAFLHHNMEYKVRFLNLSFYDPKQSALIIHLTK